MLKVILTIDEADHEDHDFILSQVVLKSSEQREVQSRKITISSKSGNIHDTHNQRG